MSMCGLLHQWDNTIQIQLSVLVSHKTDIKTHQNINCYRHDITKKNSHFALNNNLPVDH
jgi:hypothetical protein